MLTKEKLLYGFMASTALLLLMGIAYPAYKGHADDGDVNSILAAYPDLKNTAVDSCATCHKSGIVPDSDQKAGIRDENNCGYCHAVYVKTKRDIKETLNRYGAQYRAAGRSHVCRKVLSGKGSTGASLQRQLRSQWRQELLCYRGYQSQAPAERNPGF